MRSETYNINKMSAISTAFSFQNVKYILNDEFLNNLGFKKNEPQQDQENSVYRYYNPLKNKNGFDLIFVQEFGIISVEEFYMDPESGKINFRNSILGTFKVESDEDLIFIFSRNVRLYHTFYVAKRRC